MSRLAVLVGQQPVDRRDDNALASSRFDAEAAALAAGPVQGMTWHRDSFGGVPQLFVELDEPVPVVRAQLQDLVSGAHVGYCMTRVINAQDQPATPDPD